MTPTELEHELNAILGAGLRRSLMIWGPPGVGKSSIVADVAHQGGLGLIDLRLSQLAPTDLRGLPVPDHEQRVARWYPPEFLPRDGRGILFLDELNLAPPVIQGIAQQLVLDRRVGSYEVPDGWFVWAAGNRKEDRAAVFDMPAPLANRFLHFEVLPDFDSFRRWALRRSLPETLIAFLAFRPELLLKLHPTEAAWPSPRSWVLAAELDAAGLRIDAAVGSGAGAEFASFKKLSAHLPDLDGILAGDGFEVTFPKEPSLRYAMIVGLALRPRDAASTGHAARWVAAQTGPEWCRLFALTASERAEATGRLGVMATAFAAEPKLKRFLMQYARANP